MLSPELTKLKEQLEQGEEASVDKTKILNELRTLENVKVYMQHSLSVAGKACPTCGRRL